MVQSGPASDRIGTLRRADFGAEFRVMAFAPACWETG